MFILTFWSPLAQFSSSASNWFSMQLGKQGVIFILFSNPDSYHSKLMYWSSRDYHLRYADTAVFEPPKQRIWLSATWTNQNSDCKIRVWSQHSSSKETERVSSTAAQPWTPEPGSQAPFYFRFYDLPGKLTSANRQVLLHKHRTSSAAQNLQFRRDWEFMFCGYHLQVLNNSIFEYKFSKWGSSGPEDHTSNSTTPTSSSLSPGGVLSSLFPSPSEQGQLPLSVSPAGSCA